MSTTDTTSTTLECQALLSTIATLPDDLLAELANFIEYLQYKTQHQSQLSPSQAQSESSSFLLNIAGIGSSEEPDISERNLERLP